MLGRVNIKGLAFSLLSDDMLQSRSVLTIRGTDENQKGKGKRGSGATDNLSTVLDPRLGTVTPGVLCSTCGSVPEVCNGHVGDVELCVPVASTLFPHFLPKVLNCICVACAHLLVTNTPERLASIKNTPVKKRLTDLSNRSLKVRGPCGSCGFSQPTRWTMIDGIVIRPEWPTTAVQVPVVTPQHVYGLLRMTSPDTSALFGFKSSSLGQLMYCRVPIPPILVRPTRPNRMEDDLSTRLRAIIQANRTMQGVTTTSPDLSRMDDGSETTNSVTSSDWKPRHKRNKITIVPEHLEAYYEVQRQCAGLQDSKYNVKNDLDYGRELTSVRHRFTATKHRRGRVRANILGKRGDYTARGVASPNTYIDPHEVGVPIHVCMHLTIPERVFVHNRQRMQSLVDNGPQQYPGANYVERDGRRFLLPLFKSGGDLQLGDVVYRHILRGDPVLMNRQPSLHRYSMMGYRVVPMVCSTFQLHLSVTTAHNLDFDGDEVNMFVSGSLEATAEITQLMAVEQNIFKDGKLLVGFVQHACLGAYLLTCDDTGRTVLPGTVVSRVLFSSRVHDVSVAAAMTGRTLMMHLIPTYDGTYTLTKSLLNQVAARCIRTQGQGTGTRWIGGVVRALEEYLLYAGSTLTFADCTTHVRDPVLIADGIRVISHEPDEKLAVDVTDRLRSMIGGLVHADLNSRPDGNNLLNIIESGAKGNRSHVVQNVGMVGQQFDVHSKRYGTLLSHDVPAAVARGLVVSSFSDGLGPVEFFHHLMSARVGLVGTAVSTAETGYCYRRISKCLEDIRISFDHSVRTANDKLILVTGGFSMESFYAIPLHTCLLDPESPRPEQDHIRRINARIHEGYLHAIPESINLPFDIMVDIPRAPEGDTSPRITSSDIFQAVSRLWDSLRRQFVPSEVECVLFTALSSRRLTSVHGVATQQHLRLVTDHVEHSLVRALHPTGTPIGLITSQSFSAPLTQIQLNRFHHSGEGSVLVGGVARIKEIINCMKTIQTPSMRIVPVEDVDVVTCAESLMTITLRRVVQTWTMQRQGHASIVLDRAFLIDRKIVPRLVAEALGLDGVEHTRDLEATKWEIWFPASDVRAAISTLLKTNPTIRGVRGVTDYYISSTSVRSGVEGEIVLTDRPMIVTSGSNLLAVLELPWVDCSYTTTNHIHEVYTVLGIDAACCAIADNLLDVMSSNSATVSQSYIRLIAHEMCRTGVPCALTFVGLKQSDTSILKLATFERSLESFVNAARTGHHDELRGISESVIVGKPVSVGTGGDFQVMHRPPGTDPEQPKRKRRRMSPVVVESADCGYHRQFDTVFEE